MRWSDELTLLTPVTEPVESVDENGFKVEPSFERSVVYANKKSVGYSEFYKSAQQGQYARFKFDVHTVDYSSQRHAEYDGDRYMILRTFELENGEITELTLSDIVAGTGV